MGQFRKKPVVVEAEQYLAGAPVDGVCEACSLSSQPHLHTWEGIQHVTAGDWIITGLKGEKYPCKPDIFAQSYEPAGDGPEQEPEPEDQPEPEPDAFPELTPDLPDPDQHFRAGSVRSKPRRKLPAKSKLKGRK